MSFSPDRFEPIGEYRGFPVYRDKIGSSDDIWVSVVKDGPLAPYAEDGELRLRSLRPEL